MEVLGVGPLELFFILIIALIFLGPRDMVKAGRTMGKFMRKIVMSPTWRMVQQTSRELRTLPNRMIREAGMEEDLKDLDQLGKDVGNQIGSLRKPFSAAAGEANKELQEAQSDLNAPVPAAPVPAAPANPPVLGGLAAWTTPPPASEPAVEAVDGSKPETVIDAQAEQDPDTSDITPDSTTTENPNPDQP